MTDLAETIESTESARAHSEARSRADQAEARVRELENANELLETRARAAEEELVDARIVVHRYKAKLNAITVGSHIWVLGPIPEAP